MYICKFAIISLLIITTLSLTLIMLLFRDIKDLDVSFDKRFKIIYNELARAEKYRLEADKLRIKRDAKDKETVRKQEIKKAKRTDKK